MNNSVLKIRILKIGCMTRSTRCLFYVMVLAMLILIPTDSAYSSEDLLKSPALKSERNFFSWMIDVTKAGSSLVVVGEQGRIFYLEDQCIDWRQADVPVSVTITAVNFPTAEKGWAVGHNSVILHTEDGGKSWKKQIDGWEINKLMLAKTNQIVQGTKELLGSLDPDHDAEQIKTLKARLDDLVYLEQDTAFVMEQGPVRPLLDVWFKNEKEGLVVGAYGVILQTFDGGASWEAIFDRLENKYSNHLYSITPYGDALYIAGEFGILFRSDDFGENWISLDSPFEGSFFGTTGTADGTTVIVFGLRGKIFYSRDKGESWTPAKIAGEETTTIFGGVALSDGSIYLVGMGSSGVLLRSLDNGKSFSRVPVLVPPYPSSVLGADSGDLSIAGVGGVVLIAADKLMSITEGKI